MNFCCFTQIRDACKEVEEEDSVLQPRKRPRCHSGDSSSTVTTSSEKWSLSPHIGELFVYLDHSVRNEGILGITVEKTLVCTCSTFKHYWTLSHLLLSNFNLCVRNFRRYFSPETSVCNLVVIIKKQVLIKACSW